ncbi:hypothetical protein MHYP_G00127050 [Metynnis hypsauchen]
MFISETMTVDHHIYSSLDWRHGFQCIIPPGLEALDSSNSYMSSRNSGQEGCSVSGPDQRMYVEGSLDKKCSKTFRDFTISHHWTSHWISSIYFDQKQNHLRHHQYYLSHRPRTIGDIRTHEEISAIITTGHCHHSIFVFISRSRITTAIIHIKISVIIIILAMD